MSEAEIVELRGIVGAPSCRYDHRSHIYQKFFLFFVEIDRPGWTGFGERGRVGFRQCLAVEHMKRWVGHFMGIVERLDRIHAEVQIIGPFRGQLLRDRFVQRRIAGHVAWPDFEQCLEIACLAEDLLHSGECVNRDLGILPDTAGVDLKAARGRTHLWEVPVRTHYAAAEVSFLLDQDYRKANLSSFHSRSHSGYPSSYDEDGFCLSIHDSLA